MSTSSGGSGKLRVVIGNDQAGSKGHDILLIPGIGTPGVETWPFCNQQWLKDHYPNESDNPRVLTFEYSVPINDSYTWETLLMQGYDLLHALWDLRSNTGSNEDYSRPILCVCHSLGGLVWKQALCIANAQSHRYDFLVNAVTGIIFLSVPHLPTNKSDILPHFMSILKATTRKSARVPAEHAERESDILLDLAKRFQGFFFRTPVLSVYEKMESRYGASPFKSKLLLVDQQTSATHAPQEKFLALGLDHLHTCQFDKSEESDARELSSFVTETLRNGEELISARLQALEFVYATVSAYSPTLSEMAANELKNEKAEDSTGQVTHGSSGSGFEMIPPISPILVSEPQQRTVRLPCLLLDTYSSNPSFYGRESILSLIEQQLLPPRTELISQRNTGLRHFALCGLGGMGKTEIAQEFAWRHRDDFDAVFWVVADKIPKLNECYQQISLKLGLEDQSECKNQVISREIVKGWLSNPWKQISETDDQQDKAIRSTQEATWLMIFDNADDPSILVDYWPQGSGSVLVTSRDPIAKSLFSMRPSGIDLDPLEEEEAASLLMRLTGVEDDSDAESEALARRITKILGGIPLAISQMAGIIRRQELSLAEFLDLYEDSNERTDLHDKKLESIAKYPHSISTVWAIEKLKPESRKLLELISFLDPDNIDESLLVDALTEIFPDEITIKTGLYRDWRTELLQTSLVRRNKQKNELSVHRMVQDVVRAKMNDNTAKSMFHLVVRLLWSNWPSALPKPSRKPLITQPKASNTRYNLERWPLCASLYPHVLRLHQLWASLVEVGVETKLLFASLISDAAWYQSERGRNRGFDGFFDTALATCESADHPDRDSLLVNIYFFLGQISTDINDHMACRKYMEKSWEIQRKISDSLGTVDERLALAYAERAVTRIQDGRYEEGIADLKTERQIRESLGTYVPQSREANLALAYIKVGMLDEADQLLQESLKTRERIYGKNDKDAMRVGRLICALGNLRAAQGRYDESFEYHQKALEMFRSKMGDRHRRTLDTEHKIAEHLLRLGRHEEAITLINNALKTWSFDQDANKAYIARTTFLKAKVFEASGRSQKATVALKVASRLRQDITKERREPASLTVEHFDPLITFWGQ